MKMLTSRLMLILAQSILVIGAFSMIPASIKLFSRAMNLGLPSWWLWIIVPVALVVGVGKAMMVMRKRMRINIHRLRNATGKLWPWQIYPPQLLVFIIAMVVLMNVMKKVLAVNAMGLGILGGVDVAVGAALAIASLEYRRQPD